MNRVKEKSASYFDKVAKENLKIKEPQLCYPYVVDAIKEWKGKLLDVGCGEGVLIGKIKEQYDDRFELYGIDISQNAISSASVHLGHSAVLKQGDSEHLPFDDNTFDVIVCTHSFHHYPRPKIVFKEMKRCLKEGGGLFIVENYRRELPRRIRNIIYFILRYPRGDIRFYSPNEMKTLYESVGFREFDCEQITNKSFIAKGRG